MKESIKIAVKEALQNCKLSREEVADEIGRLTGDELSVHTLNHWCASSKLARRMPVEFLAAFCVVTKDRRLLEVALGIANLHVLDDEQMAFYELGVVTAQEREQRKRKRVLCDRLGI